MKQVTVFVKVGRADPQPLATFPDDNKCDVRCDAIQHNKMAELLRSGVDPARIEFTRETTDAPNGDKKGRK